MARPEPFTEQGMEPLFHATPGPFTYHPDLGEIQATNNILIAIVDGPHNRGIDWTPNDDERRDNGQILAAAHEMHEALLAQERVSAHGQTCSVCTDIETDEDDISCPQFSAMWEWAEGLRTKALNKVIGGR